MQIVVDSSVAAPWLLPDGLSDAAERVLDARTSDAAQVPAHFWFEIRNVLVIAERRGRIGKAIIENAFGHLKRLPISIDRLPPQNGVQTRRWPAVR